MKRMLIAVAAMLVVAVLLGELVPMSGWIQPAVSGLVGAALGGFVARRPFVLVALLVHVAVWGLILYTLHAIGDGRTGYASLAATNMSAMALSFPLVALGAFVGEHAATRLRARRVAANA
ncbi:hypothetical protein [Lysobacter sp. N42]|uniref:hypothetical protein n=1 Tax=Lysobacter sp. N42 TaxID=2545719 RepID=UPI00104623E8|nr:hypothetical protein [Lysobacter sp. N42]TCZ77609.1 hypothetical protein EYQ95_26010 [Lysobacter sp. N42]